MDLGHQDKKHMALYVCKIWGGNDCFHKTSHKYGIEVENVMFGVWTFSYFKTCLWHLLYD